MEEFRRKEPNLIFKYSCRLFSYSLVSVLVGILSPLHSHKPCESRHAFFIDRLIVLIMRANKYLYAVQSLRERLKWPVPNLL